MSMYLFGKCSCHQQNYARSAGIYCQPLHDDIRDHSFSSVGPDYPIKVYFASLHYFLCICYALLMYNVIVLL